MALISYHASHEQFPPSRLLACAELAERVGFDSLFSSDHFHPWSEAQGQAGFSWSWLGAALARTQIPGALICCPGYRYHPAVVAQAAATLAEMFPGRFWLGLGSGEQLNERITGLPWMAKDQRNALLRECVEIIRALWAGETVSHAGLVHVCEARVYTLPAEPIQLFGAAITETTAEWLGGWADGLLTTSRPPDDLRSIIEAFQRGGGEGKPVVVKVGLSYGETDAEARSGAHEQWRSVAFPGEMLAEMRTARDCEAAGQRVSPEQMDRSLRISSSLQQHLDWLAADFAAGADQIILHNINTNQEQFVEDFAEGVLPYLRPALV